MKERGDGPADWKLTNKVSNTNLPDDGKKYVWYQHHGPNIDKSGKHNGIYMLAPHNHDKWFAKNKNKSEIWKDYQKERNSTSKKRKVSFKTDSNIYSNTDKREKNGKLEPAILFQSALVTKGKISDTEVQEVLDNAIENSNKYSDYNSDNESK